MKLLMQIFLVPSGLGALGVMLALEKNETWFYRSFGAAVALLFSPFLILLMVYLIGSDLLEQFSSRKPEKQL